MIKLFETVVARCMKVVSALVQAGEADGDGEALSREETVSIMLQMLFAGHETTTKLMANSFRRLLEDREPVLDQQAAAQGQRGEERGGATGGAKVSWVQHLE